MNRELNNLLWALRADLDRPDFWWQIVILVLSIGVAKGLELLLKRRAVSLPGVLPEASFRERGVKRLLFPLTALLLVALGRYGLRPHPTNLLAITMPLLGSLALIRAVFFVIRLSFSRAAWMAVFERSFASLAWCVVALHILGWLPELVQWLDSVGFHAGKQWVSLWLMIQGVFMVALSVLLALWLGGVAEDRLARSEGLDGNLKLVFVRLVKTVLLLLAVLISLPMVGIDLTTLSVFGGALGVGLGLGLQKVAANYVSGFIILLDRSIRIGNVISVAGDRGEVTRITTRFTVLRSLTGVESIVPNEVLMGSVVQNESFSDRKVRIALPVQVAYASDLEQCLALLEGAARSETRVLTDPAPQALVSAFADSGINLEIGFWIADPEKGSAMLKSNINLAIWRAFKANGIEIPFPQREVRVLNG